MSLSNDSELKSFPDEIFIEIGQHIDSTRTLLNMFTATRGITQAFADSRLLRKTLVADIIDELSESGRFFFVSPIILGTSALQSTVKPISEKNILKDKWAQYFLHHPEYTLEELKSLYHESILNRQVLSDIVPAFFKNPYLGAHRLSFMNIAKLTHKYSDLAIHLMNFAKFNHIDVNTPNSAGQSALSSFLNEWHKNQSKDTFQSILFLINHGATINHLTHSQQLIFEQVQALSQKIYPQIKP